MTDGEGRTRRDEIRDMLYFRHPSGRVYHALPKMNPLPAEEAPLAAVLRAWHEAGRAEDALQARWERAVMRRIPPEYRANPWEDPERTVYQAFKDPKVLRLRGFWDAAQKHVETTRQQVVATRAVTLAGIVAKLRKAPDDDLMNSALADLKRVARTGAG